MGGDYWGVTYDTSKINNYNHMKRLIFIISILVVIVACSTQKKAIKVNTNSEEISAEDTIEYDIETFDSEFETWYAVKNNPALYRSQSYYENWNKKYVAAWNTKAISSVRNSIFEPIVGYEPGVDYGFELNHHLFYYFQYVENVLKMKILTNSPNEF